MNGRLSVATFNDPGFFRGERSCVAAFGKNKHSLVDPAVGMQARRKFSKDFGIGVHDARDGVRSPAFQKRFTHRDARPRRQLHSANVMVDLAPAGGSEFAERVVLRANTLQIQKEMPLAVSSARVPVGQLTPRRPVSYT